MKKTKLRKQKRNKLYFQHYPWIPEKYYGVALTNNHSIGTLETRTSMSIDFGLKNDIGVIQEVILA